LRRDAFFAWQNAEFIRSYLEAIYADVQRTLDGIRAVAQRDAAAKKRRALQEHQTQVQAYQRRTPGGKTVKVKSHKRRVMKRPPIPKYKAISDE
jgi:Skp family chaperone for outer membrane proteins